MTPSDERRLYETDRPAWLRLIAPKMPAVIDANTDEELARSWGMMGRDFQEAVWAHLSEAQRERVRMVRNGALPDSLDKLTDAQAACLRGEV